MGSGALASSLQGGVRSNGLASVTLLWLLPQLLPLHRSLWSGGQLECFLTLSRRVDNKLLRELVLASDISTLEIARRLGYYRKSVTKRNGRKLGPYGVVDDSRLRRALGLKSDPRTHKTQTKISEDTAVKIGEALGLAPYEIGL
jgi:hypothetical protein